MKAMALLPVMVLSGCMMPRDCGTMPGGYAAATIERLQCGVGLNDKQAQLELGIRYEEGRGVPSDPRQAMRLYRRAAQSDPAQLWIYSPPVGNERYGRVIPIAAPNPSPGLPEARERLDRLRAQLRPEP